MLTYFSSFKMIGAYRDLITRRNKGNAGDLKLPVLPEELLCLENRGLRCWPWVQQLSQIQEKSDMIFFVQTKATDLQSARRGKGFGLMPHTRVTSSGWGQNFKKFSPYFSTSIFQSSHSHLKTRILNSIS